MSIFHIVDYVISCQDFIYSLIRGLASSSQHIQIFQKKFKKLLSPSPNIHILKLNTGIQFTLFSTMLHLNLKLFHILLTRTFIASPYNIKTYIQFNSKPFHLFYTFINFLFHNRLNP